MASLKSLTTKSHFLGESDKSSKAPILTPSPHWIGWPIEECSSKTIGEIPLFERVKAAVKPAGPPPTIATSIFFINAH